MCIFHINVYVWTLYVCKRSYYTTLNVDFEGMCFTHHSLGLVQLLIHDSQSHHLIVNVQYYFIT